MNLLDTLLNNQGGETVKSIAKSAGLGESDTKSILEKLAPAVAKGINNNASNESGLESLIGALNKGSHQRYLDEPNTLGQKETIDEGNAILGHIFGSKDVSRNVASHAAKETGQDSGVIKKMLPMVAATIMGALSKQNASLGSLGSAFSGGQDTSSKLGMLGSFLDSDKDGEVMDDVLKMAKKFF
jgi:hypothetical protein